MELDKSFGTKAKALTGLINHETPHLKCSWKRRYLISTDGCSIDGSGVAVLLYLLDTKVSYGCRVSIDGFDDGVRKMELMFTKGFNIRSDESELVLVDDKTDDALPVVGGDVLEGDGGLACWEENWVHGISLPCSLFVVVCVCVHRVW